MDSRNKIIEELRAVIAKQAAVIAQLTARVTELELQLAKANKDSSNSSKPPSSDIAKPKSPAKKTSRKKPRQGGQPGHQRKLRQPLPEDRVDEVVDDEIDDGNIAKLGLTPTGEFETIQHIELPESPIHVTEHRLAVYQDRDGNIYLPNCPLFGPRLLATIGWLKSVAHCSYSTLERWLEDVLQVPVSRGYLAKLCNDTISASLADTYDELTAAIPQQQQLGSDETSIKNNGKKHWIWCIAAKAFSVFHMAKTRSRAVLEKLVGEEFKGYLNFDYFSANCSFAWNYSVKAQYCWAHLIRDMRFLEKHPDEKTKAWAEQLLDRSRRLFSAWHHREQMTEHGFERSMTLHRDRFLELVRQPPQTKEATNLAARFAIIDFKEEGSSEVEQYDLSQDYFRFLFANGLEPTNNHSEQQIRHCVIDRKITQGTRSESGQRYHERMWTMIATCKKQNRNIFNFLQESITAHLKKQPAPTLLPN